MVVLMVIPYSVNIMHISDSSDSRRSSDDDGNEYGCPQDDEDLKEDIRANPFRTKIREVSSGFSFLGGPMVNSEMVKDY